MQGRLITLEGADAAGKTTQLAFLVRLLREKGYDVIQTREPGGTYVAERLRSIVLTEKLTPVAEMLLFAAMRAEHMEDKILPALKKGQIVVSDRFADSTYAYQGIGRNQLDRVEMLEKFVLGDFQPDHTLFFDIPLEESQKRLNGRMARKDVFEKEVDGFKERVYAGYLRRYEENPHRMVRINSMGSIEEVNALVRAWVEEVFVPANPL